MRNHDKPIESELRHTCISPGLYRLDAAALPRLHVPDALMTVAFARGAGSGAFVPMVAAGGTVPAPTFLSWPDHPGYRTLRIRSKGPRCEPDRAQTHSPRSGCLGLGLFSIEEYARAGDGRRGRIYCAWMCSIIIGLP